MKPLTRRSVLLGGLGLVGASALAGCASGGGSPVTGTPASAPLTPAPGRQVVEKALTAKPVTLDLGGVAVDTWAYGDTAPGPLIRATAGDLLRVRLTNQLPDETSIHWHGVHLQNAADGVPGVTQDPIAPGTDFTYEFTVPDPGTYFFHPHVGLQLDRGLYAPFVVDDPAEPGRYDQEWIVVLDDWLDGTGRTPDQAYDELVAAGGTGNGMGMGMGGMDHSHLGPAPWGAGGDVTYPHYLINGKVPAAPDTLSAKPGQRVRIRVINAASDTIFTVALGGHTMTVTHSDGFPVQPQQTSAFYIGMGERYDVEVTVADGVFPLVAVPFDKTGQALAMVRTGAGSAPAATVRPAELDGQVLIGSALLPADAARLPDRSPDASADLNLQGSMQPYEWGINGAQHGANTPISVEAGKRLRLNVTNMTMMPHPLHVHGHTFALANGLRKDTVLLGPMDSGPIDLQADNPGEWMIHCHNIYHAVAGMMIQLSYRPDPSVR